MSKQFDASAQPKTGRGGRPPSLGRRIALLQRLGRSHLDREFAELELTHATYPFLMDLYHQDGCRQEQLCRRLHIDKAVTARAIGKLEALGYVRRESDPEDGRAWRVKLTAKARRMEPYVREVLRQYTRTLSQGLSPAEMESFHRLLERAAANLVADREARE